MSETINTELAKIDRDYAVKVTIGDTVKAVGKKLVTAKGEFTITAVVVQHNKITISNGEKTADYNLDVITNSILAGKMSIK